MEYCKIFKKTIKKTVSNSQRIENYALASKPLKEQVKEIMAKYNVKISA